MRPFRRRRATRRSSEADVPAPADIEQPGAEVPLEGRYVTDGASLFRVANAIRDTRRGELLLEIEDCRTLELTLCPADAVVLLELETVVPAQRPAP
jgi:hypothetical protein